MYLQGNFITTATVLLPCTRISHLYLQHNKISSTLPFREMRLLRKLFLGYNEIACVEGLAGLINLRELHVECQRLALPVMSAQPAPPPALVFEWGLAGTRLETLNLAGNGLTSTEEFALFENLLTLDLSRNNIDSVDALAV